MVKWMLKQCRVDTMALARQTGLDPITTYVLASRGYHTSQKIKSFIQSELNAMADPLSMVDMDRGTNLILSAIENGRKIAVFGDYDADGVMSTVILYKAILALGGNVTYYIPQREAEGYGLNNGAILHLQQEKQVEVLLTCDNGISAIDQVEYAKTLGMQVIVLDHHQLAFTIEGDTEQKNYLLPAADAVIDTKRPDCQYPFKMHCAAGLAYLFTQVLVGKAKVDWQKFKEEFLVLAAIASVCDMVDLVEENRAIVKYGLDFLTNTKNIGLQALLTAIGLQGKKINTYHVGFMIGPCINASGRLEIANMAVEMLLTEDQQKAAQLAQQLVELNHYRKEITAVGADMVLKKICAENLQQDKIIVIYHPEIHESVTGIIAGRIKEHFHRPTIILAGSKEIIRGSGRSVEAYDLFEGVSKCRSFLSVFGGHPMAAGLSMPIENLLPFRQQINEQCELTEEQLEPQLRIDCQIPLENINYQLAHNLKVLEPFGKNNPMPIFADKNILLAKISLLGKDQQVVKLTCRMGGRNSYVDIIAFNKRNHLEEMICNDWSLGDWNRLLLGKPPGIRLDLVYSAEEAIYNNHTYLQIKLIDARPAVLHNR